MVLRQIEFDEETDRSLTALAQDHGGDLNQTLAELMRTRESLESFLDQCEENHQAQLRQQLEASQRDFRAGSTVPWTEVKRRNHL
jgi:uncharacterized NAD(P)/FAD-binding protein YdhS